MTFYQNKKECGGDLNNTHHVARAQSPESDTIKNAHNMHL
jgi:hypothetical protein